MPHDHHDHDHDHDHGHHHHGLSPSGHPYRQDDDAPLTYWQRMADSLREEVAETGKVKAKAGEDAMSAVIAAIRDLVASGDMVMRQRGAEDGDD